MSNLLNLFRRLSKLLPFIILLILSFLLETKEWAEQETAFLWVTVALCFLLLATAVVLKQVFPTEKLIKISAKFLVRLILIALASWGLCTLLVKDFKLVFELLTCGTFLQDFLLWKPKKSSDKHEQQRYIRK
ncbi:MAG: hypothetical protein Q4G09_06455 [Clostridia bacterium]|nr:hypothetical protein [Clostridia bacterium]